MWWIFAVRWLAIATGSSIFQKKSGSKKRWQRCFDHVVQTDEADATSGRIPGMSRLALELSRRHTCVLAPQWDNRLHPGLVQLAGSYICQGGENRRLWCEGMVRDAQFGTLTGEMSTFTWPRILESRVNEELIRLLWPPEELLLLLSFFSAFLAMYNMISEMDQTIWICHEKKDYW